MGIEEKQSLMSKLRWFGVGGAIIGLGAASTYFLWSQLSLKTPSDVMIVKAVEGPIKVKPLDPGGTTVAHQNFLVIDILKNGVVSSGEVETLRPDPQIPEPPPIKGGKLANAKAKPEAVTKTADNTSSATIREIETTKPQKKSAEKFDVDFKKLK